MATPKITVKTREHCGRIESKHARQHGLVPAVIYGHGKETKSVVIPEKEIARIVNRHGETTMINIEFEGRLIPSIIKEVQRGVLDEKYLHVDLQELSENEEVKLHIPLIFENQKAVETSDTVVEHQMVELDISCLPKYIPHHVSVDASRLAKNHIMKVSDLDIFNDDHINILNDSDQIVATLNHSQKMDHEEETTLPIYESEKSILG